MPNIYPVIHLRQSPLEHTLNEVAIAQRAGAQGVFLISHTGEDDFVVQRADSVKRAVAGFKVGINLLSTDNITALRLAIDCNADMLWVDAPGLTSQEITPEARIFADAALYKPSLVVFGSVAFKYQAVDTNPPLAAQNALALGFRPTTSGTGTGSAPTVEKIAAMSTAVKGKLAVASGMTPENVGLFAPYLSDILVATGVGKNEYEIDEGKLTQLVQNATAAVAETPGVL